MKVRQNKHFKSVRKQNIFEIKMAVLAGMENEKEDRKTKKTPHPVYPDTRRHSEEAEKRVKPSVVPFHPGR